MRNEVICYINGEKHSLKGKMAFAMLSDYLRYEACLTGTKVVCAEGDCGACTVLKYFPLNKNTIDGKSYIAINSCITPMATLDGASLITVDKLAHENELHEAQKAMVNSHGSQCGFCTPGFVMAMAGLVEEKINSNSTTVNEQEAKNALTGNLCRCTGYDGIIQACKQMDIKNEKKLKDRFYSNIQEETLTKASSEEILIEEEDFLFYAPTDISKACSFLNQHPETKIIASSTDLGVIHNKRIIKLNKLLSLHLIKDLYQTTEESQFYRIGSRVNLTDLRHYLKDKNDEFVKYLDIFASPQIKNLGTLAGNIANASPIGDTPPALLALNAQIELFNSLGEARIIPLEDFFLDYRKTALQKDEIITYIHIPKLGEKSFYKVYKNSNRKDLDISTVNFAMYVNDNKFNIACGGIAATPIRLKKTEEYLNNNKIDLNNLDDAINILQSEFSPLSDVRGTDSYRRLLIKNYFKRSLSQYMEHIS
jgi:xanthine dehydrogenase small subunit